MQNIAKDEINGGPAGLKYLWSVAVGAIKVPFHETSNQYYMIGQD